ncbi:hypothetical protein P4G73_08705 [Bacillus cereus]|nr:hypothetical protein [Bacillus cereus]
MWAVAFLGAGSHIHQLNVYFYTKCGPST